jgi:hypothetical protein
MDAAQEANVSELTLQKEAAPEEQLGELFGSYRAEWLSERLYELFTAPAYFPEMTAPTACVLEGGRGTGKTTVLRGLSYEGQFALRGHSREAMPSVDFIGCYVRVDTNVVTAFAGTELPLAGWTKLFAHYFNLLICEQLTGFWVWYADTIGLLSGTTSEGLADVAVSLHLPKTTDARSLKAAIHRSIVEFEAFINNVGDVQERPRISLQGAPIRLVAEALRTVPEFASRRFFILLDEYENFLEYQQQVVNTLIKHGAPRLTYKIAIRELGWKCRTTLNPEEQLRSPADYVRINIREKLEGSVFRDFALKVCNDRIRRLTTPGIGENTSIADLLPSLSEEDEAVLLAGADFVRTLRNDLATSVEPDLANAVRAFSAIELLLIRYWAKVTGKSELELTKDAIKNPPTWSNRRNNYAHAMLFTLRRGKAGIRKYYSGWETFIHLADGNIRFLLALVDQCLHLQLRAKRDIGVAIKPDMQTKAAQMVGKSNLAELEGLSVYGAKLTKLLLGLGRVFGVMAAQAEGHIPEATEFEIGEEGDSEPHDDVDELLRAAVMHLALVRPAGTKPTDDGDTKDYDYMVHPIFAPFFEFSHRRKRKIRLVPSDIRGLVQRPPSAIDDILQRHKRQTGEPLSEQLSLFRQFYSDADR